MNDVSRETTRRSAPRRLPGLRSWSWVLLLGCALVVLIAWSQDRAAYVVVAALTATIAWGGAAEHRRSVLQEQLAAAEAALDRLRQDLAERGEEVVRARIRLRLLEDDRGVTCACGHRINYHRAARDGGQCRSAGGLGPCACQYSQEQVGSASVQDRVPHPRHADPHRGSAAAPSVGPLPSPDHFRG